VVDRSAACGRAQRRTLPGQTEERTSPSAPGAGRSMLAKGQARRGRWRTTPRGRDWTAGARGLTRAIRQCFPRARPAGTEALAAELRGEARRRSAGGMKARARPMMPARRMAIFMLAALRRGSRYFYMPSHREKAPRQAGTTGARCGRREVPTWREDDTDSSARRPVQGVGTIFFPNARGPATKPGRCGSAGLAVPKCAAEVGPAFVAWTSSGSVPRSVVGGSMADTGKPGGGGQRIPDGIARSAPHYTAARLWGAAWG